jgi:ADP-ribosyl-[dinitrogen reductase] hydrolase
MLLELAVADAYAISFEFVKDWSKHGLVNDLSGYQQHPEYSDLKPSQYTDDTQRTIATGWTICSGDWADPTNFLHTLLAEYQRSPRTGYSKRFQTLIESMEGKTGIDVMRAITRRADSNGSIMGCLPCGFLPLASDVRIAATSQAIATHSFSTVPYAQSMALCVNHFLRGGERRDLPLYLITESEGPSEGSRPKVGGVSMKASDTCAAVLHLLGCGEYSPRYESLSEVLLNAVALKGDTDSVAALAVGIASLSGEFEKDLPRHLIDGLEWGDDHTRSDLMLLDDTLHMVFNGE